MGHLKSFAKYAAIGYGAVYVTNQVTPRLAAKLPASLQTPTYTTIFNVATAGLTVMVADKILSHV